MRMLAKISIPVDGGNKAILSGEMPNILSRFSERAKPEAMYFTLEDGRRTAYCVFDLTDSSDLPSICEPLFNGLGAEVTCAPCMTPPELKVGLGKIARK